MSGTISVNYSLNTFDTSQGSFIKLLYPVKIMLSCLQYLADINGLTFYRNCVAFTHCHFIINQ